MKVNEKDDKMKTIAKAAVCFLFVAASAYEIDQRLIRGIPWMGFSLDARYFVYPLATAWLIGAYAAWSRSNVVAAVGVTIAAILLLTHGVVLALSGHYFGRVIFFGGVINIFFILEGNLLRLGNGLSANWDSEKLPRSPRKAA